LRELSRDLPTIIPETGKTSRIRNTL